MTFWDWLSSPVGSELTRVVILLIAAFTGWLNWRVRQHQKELQKQLDGHLELHLLHDAAVTDADHG